MEGPESEVKAYYEHAGITIYHGDCRDFLGHVRGDILVADPPYGETALEWDACAQNWTMAAAVSVGIPASRRG